MKHFLTFALIGALSLGIAGCKEEQKAAGAGPAAGGPMPVKVAAPTLKKITEWDEYTGRFQARERVEIRARVSGYLENVNFTDGQIVAKDDILFVIDQRPFKIDVERAESSFDTANKEYERAQKLRKSSAISEEDLDNAFQSYREAKANLDEAKLNLEFTEVKSPIAGRMSRNLLDVGNLVSGADTGGTLLATVVATDPIDFYFEASEQDVLKYARLDIEGSRESSRTMKRPAYLKLQDEDDFSHEGVIDFVDNEIDRSTGTLQGRAVFTNKDDHFIPGIFGRLRIAGSGEYEATLVPEAVIGINQTQKFVYVVGKDNMVEARPVVTGPMQDGGMRVIREGLSATDQVITSGLTILRPGMPVTPQRAEEAPAAADAASSKE